MPAKTKYLTTSGWKRFSKIIATIFGAYAASVLLHIVFIKNMENDAVALLTSAFSIYFFWVGFMVMVYLVKRVWISWAILLSVILISSSLIYI